MAKIAKKFIEPRVSKKKRTTVPTPLELVEKKAKKAETLGLGSARGVESMLRNSYRAQLAMIALAATKANIMISVNGFLLSMLTVSSAYVLRAAPMLLIPLGIFLLTCLISILFAVLAARPQKVPTVKTRLRDFNRDRVDLLVFEHFAQLSKADYMTAMTEMMHDQDRVYKAMIAHLHFLGTAANRRFNLLHISYSAFLVGLVISAVALCVVVALLNF